MEWLKDKKNLPVVTALAVVFLLAALGLIGFEEGLFGGGSSSPPVASGPPPTGPLASGPPVPGAPGAPPYGAGPPYGGGPGGGLRPGAPYAGGPGRTASALLPGKAVPVKKLIPPNPAVGPDPFGIPGGQKKALIASRLTSGSGMKLPLREIIGPLNLFQIHPPAPALAPPVVGAPGQQTGQDLAANYRFSGIATGPDGSVSGILEVGGQSQTVKPGDNLPDGSQVEDIQATSITLKTAGGTDVSLPLSAGNPDQGTPGQNDGQPPFNGPPNYPGAPNYPGSPNNPGDPGAQNYPSPPPGYNGQ